MATCGVYRELARLDTDELAPRENKMGMSIKELMDLAKDDNLQIDGDNFKPPEAKPALAKPKAEKPKASNREAWLAEACTRLKPLFEAHDAMLPDKLRVAIGFTSRGKRSKAIGECWADSASEDGTFEIFIRPNQAEPLEVLAVLAHELVHASVGLEAGHGKPFRALATAIGLTGKMRSTVPGDQFKSDVEPILAALGPIPHAKLIDGANTGPKKQAGRYAKCQCPDCGYIARVVKQWLAQFGPPICPCNNQQMHTDALIPEELLA